MSSKETKAEMNSTAAGSPAPGLEQDILNTYGPLIELGDLARLLHRNRNSIRNAVVKAEKCPDKAEGFKWALKLAENKFRIGRKIMFRTQAVVGLILSGEV